MHSEYLAQRTLWFIRIMLVLALVLFIGDKIV